MADTEICRAMTVFAHKFGKLEESPPLRVQDFTDGLPFAVMLTSAKYKQLSFDDLDLKCTKWINKVSNLKKILMKIHSLFEKRLQSASLIEDIDVVQIAKHCSQLHLAKFFKVVMAVLLASSEKDYYIQVIMDLDNDVQKTFVEIIKETSHNDPFSGQQNSSIAGLEQEIKQLKTENAQLKSEVNDLSRKNKYLQRQLKELRQKIINYEQEKQEYKDTKDVMASDELQSQIDQQRLLIDNLKLKLLTTVRESEMQISHMKEQVISLKAKCQNVDEMESTLEQYKQLYNQALVQLQKMNDIEKEKRKHIRVIEEKDQLIRKLQGKIENTIEKNCSMQSNQIMLQVELDKREARFKQLERELKTRLKSEPSELPTKGNQLEVLEDQRDQIIYLEEELKKAKSKIKDVQKQNIKNRKKLERITELQKQKKKLERIIAQVNKCKDGEIEMLVVSLYDLRNENIKMFEMLKQAHIQNAKGAK